MNSTNDSNSYETSPTPPPKTAPNSPPPNKPRDEADAELEELSLANELLSKQAQSLSAQVISLNALLAERGMAEIWRHKWADLGRVATTDYAPGRYRIDTPETDDRPLQVTLKWIPGEVLLCESFHRTTENTLTLPLPQVRLPMYYQVRPPDPGTIPPRPPDAWGTTRGADELIMQEKYSLAWQAYLKPVLTEAHREQTASETEATQDEEELAYEAIQAVQERRQNPNPKTPRDYTIAAELEMTAEQMRERVLHQS